MRIGQVMRTLASGGAIYVVMAACGAASDSGGSSSGSSGGDGGGSSGRDGAEIIDAMLDELGNPVKDAMAGPADVATEPCDKQWLFPGGGGAYVLYAAHAYGGKSVNDLAALRVVGHVKDTGPASRPVINGQTFEHTVSLPQLRDGLAIVQCGTNTTQNFDSVTFILP